jgi:BirA family transcriptional regulator, biotin operon repressor / biotin---[acetyl-CoA-carboxylase] ligase
LIEIISETGSTNADLAERLRTGSYQREGDWLITDRQSAGKGRLGRVWADGTGNFMGSSVVHIAPGDPPPHTLALLAGLAVHAVVAVYIPPPMVAMLKWPNDLLIGGAKLAGILLERQMDSVIIGIGVNLADAPQLPDRPTIALTQFGPAPSRDHFAATLAAQFAEDLHRWRSYGLAPILSRWLAAAHPVGTALSVGDISGQFAGLTPDGALRLTLSDGGEQIIHAGEVHLG